MIHKHNLTKSALLKATILGMATLTLVATTGDTDNNNPVAYTGDYYKGVDETAAAAIKVTKKIEFKNFDKTNIKDVESFDVDIDGTTYKLKRNGESGSGAPLYDNSADSYRDKNIIILRTTRGNLEHAASFKVYEAAKSDTFKTDGNLTNGYAIGGQKTTDIPTTGMVKYSGGFQGSINNKIDKTKWSFMLGDTKLAVDFAAGKIVGGFEGVSILSSTDTDAGFVDTDGKFEISAGLNTEGVFTNTIKSDEKLTTALKLSSPISGEGTGRFFGANAAEFVGNAHLENPEEIGNFGFYARKDQDENQ